MIGAVIFAAVGITFLVIAYHIGIKFKISLINDYHHDKMSEENKRPYCRLVGIGMAICGIGMCVSAVILAITDRLIGFIPFTIAFPIGLTVIIFATCKYNK